MKGFKVIHISGKFHLHRICSSRVLDFQMFLYSCRNYHVRPLLVVLLARSSPSYVKFSWNFGQWCYVTWCIRYIPIFIVVLVNGRYWSKKLIFWHILRGFSFTPAYSLRVTPWILVKRKNFWRCIIVASFISIASVIVKL